MIAFLDLLDTQEEKNKFEQLYHKYSNLLMWIAMKMLNDKHSAEEVVQDAFLYIAMNFHKIGKIDSKMTKSYLCAVVKGFAINKYNKENKVINLSEETGEWADLSANDEKFLNSLDEIELKDAINCLSDESKNYLYLTYVYGYTSKEIAEMYHISPELVRKKIQFAKRDVKKYYESGAVIE